MRDDRLELRSFTKRGRKDTLGILVAWRCTACGLLAGAYRVRVLPAKGAQSDVGPWRVGTCADAITRTPSRRAAVESGSEAGAGHGAAGATPGAVISP